MKTYKHKTLWWIAKEKTNGDYRIYKQDKWLEKDIMDYVHCNLFVGSQDREEVVEQPPKRMRDVIEEYNKNYTHLNDWGKKWCSFCSFVFESLYWKR